MLLDQFAQGLKEMGLLPLMQQFPQDMSKLFVFTGNLDPDEVFEAVYIDEDNLDSKDAFVFSLFQKYIQGLTCSGKLFIGKIFGQLNIPSINSTLIDLLLTIFKQRSPMISILQ